MQSVRDMQAQLESLSESLRGAHQQNDAIRNEFSQIIAQKDNEIESLKKDVCMCVYVCISALFKWFQPHFF